MSRRRRDSRSSGSGMPSSSRRPLTRERHERQVRSGRLTAVPDQDNADGWIVELDGVPSSYLDTSDPSHVGFEYLEIMQAVLDELSPGPVHAVHLGAAGCSLPRAINAARPGSRQIAVDIDDELLIVVRQWFDLPRSPALRLRHGDGRDVLRALHTASQDVIVRDAFAPDVTPLHLTTSEFLTEVHRVLRPGGIYLANVADRRPLDGTRAEAATARAVFGAGPVAIVAEPSVMRGRRYGNLVLLAVREPGPHDEGHGDTPAGGDHPERRASELDRADSARDILDVNSATLQRRLWSLTPPVRILTARDPATGTDSVGALIAGASPRHDPPSANGPATTDPGCADNFTASATHR